MASTSAERQRKRRQRLRNQGVVDVTVSVPKKDSLVLRQFARGLRDGSTMSQPHQRFFEAIKALKSIQPQLQDSGVLHAGVFGSTARGENRPGSDIDVLVDIDSALVGDVVEYIKIIDRIRRAMTLHCPGAGVDVADKATLKHRIRHQVERDVLYAF